MLVFDVQINGKRVARAGMMEQAVLSLTVTASRNDSDSSFGEIRLNLGGLTRPDGEGVSHHVRWSEAETIVHVGDSIGMRVVDSDIVDPPLRRYRSDREVQESPFTEAEERDLRYKDFLELKNEFEPDTDR